MLGFAIILQTRRSSRLDLARSLRWLAGLGFTLSNLAPLFLMCDPRDLSVHTDPAGTVNGDALTGEAVSKDQPV